jgi:ketosteroid isomerase-like protein
MSVALTQVRDIFKSHETGDGGEFFTHVADDVDWIVEGTHPLAVITTARGFSGPHFRKGRRGRRKQ